VTVDYKRKLNQLRLNLFLAMILLLSSAVFAAIYGVVYLVNLWRLGNLPLGIASCVAAYIVAFLLIAAFGLVYKRLQKRMVEIKAQLPVAVSEA
jgi:hypothetical protein